MTLKQFWRQALVWGFVLWLIGYGLGIALFPVVPAAWLGWVIMPLGTAITLWVLLKKIYPPTEPPTKPWLGRSLIIGATWLAVAVIADYFLLYKLFQPADGYYKPDVYLYYLLAFALPLIVGWRKAS